VQPRELLVVLYIYEEPAVLVLRNKPELFRWRRCSILSCVAASQCDVWVHMCVRANRKVDPAGWAICVWERESKRGQWSSSCGKGVAMTAAMPVAPVPAAPRPSPSSAAALPPQSVLPSLLRRSHLLSNTIPLCFYVLWLCACGRFRF
jgi:hypothetical protein